MQPPTVAEKGLGLLSTSGSITKPNEHWAGEVFAAILERCLSMEHDPGLRIGKGTSITAAISKYMGLCSGTTTGSTVMKECPLCS